jgi:predicted Ser/Thr protein kinase
VLEATNVAHAFTFEEITTVTHHFSAILGKGGFGFVYRGTLANGVEVAVKVMSEQSQHGAEEFLNEVNYNYIYIYISHCSG